MSMSKFFRDSEENFYYIHRHIEHFKKSEAIDLFENQKNQNYAIMKQRYKENYLKNISGISQKAQDKIALATQENEILNNLDEALLDTLNNLVSKEIKKYNLDETMKLAHKSLETYIKTEDLKDLDNLFAQITKASEILRSHPAEIITAIGRSNWLQSGRDLGKIRKDIQAQIIALNNKKIRVSKKETEIILKELDKLAEGLSAKELNKRSLTTILTRIFSTVIGEFLVSKGVVLGLDEAHAKIKNSLVGEKHLKVTDSLQDLLNTYKRTNLTFKTDNSFQDLELSLEDGETFKVNLGLSTKWYQGVGNSGPDSVHITKESHFIDKIGNLFSTREGKYYVYNSLALVQQDNEPYSALKASIVARAADFIISGLGEQGDFTQFIVINGTFYSIWQIILALEFFNEGQGHSGLGEGKTDPITISATGLSDIARLTQEAQNKIPNLHEAFRRSRQQNILMDSLAMEGYFYPQRLANALKKMGK